MILPDNLAPLPVTSRGEIGAGEEDFVLPGDVRRVLLGEVSLASGAGGGRAAFAGGPGCGTEQRSPRAAEDAALPAFEGEGIHPAFEPLPASRRAEPPRLAVDRESDFGRPGFGERWWVFGMGLAAAAMLFSGVVVDFVSREAERRGRFALPQAPPVPVLPSGERVPETGENPPESFAATAHGVVED